MKTFNILAAGLLALAVPSAALAQAEGKPGADAGWSAEEFRINRAFLVGAWTDDGDCDHAVEFLGDGRFFGTGGITGIWQLDGHELTITSDDILTVQVVPIDDDTIGVISPDGGLGQSTRCETPINPLPGLDETV